MRAIEREQEKKDQENLGHGQALIQKFKRGESAESLDGYCNSIVQFIRYCHVSSPYVNFELYTIVGILEVVLYFFSLRYRWPLQI